EAIEASDRPASAPPPRYEAPVQESEPHFFVMDDQPTAPGWLRALIFVARIVLFPVRHPVRALAVALLVLVLLYAARGVVVLGQQSSVFCDGSAATNWVDRKISSGSSFDNERIRRRAKEENAPPTPPAPPASPTTAAAPSAPPSVAPAASPSPTTPSA